MRPQGLTFCLLAILACSVCHAAVLQGLVLEQHTGQALDQVRVELVGASSRAVTGTEGRFRLPAVKPGAFRLTLTREGYADVAVAGVISADMEVVIRLPKSGAISGEVRNAEGQPVRGALVMPLRLRGETRTPEPLRDRAAYTDDRGVYRLFGLLPGEYRLAASVSQTPAETLNSVMAIVSGDELKQADFSFRWQQPKAVAGRVEAPETARPILLRLSPEALPFTTTAETLAEPDGSFRFASVPPGAYQLFGMGPSMGNSGLSGILGRDPVFARDGGGVTVQADDVTVQPLSAAPGHTVAFALEGNCSASGTLQLRSEEEWGSRSRISLELAVEPISVSNLPPARYFATMSGLQPGCFYAGDAVLDLTKAPPEHLKLRVARAATLRGELIGPGKDDAAMVVLWPVAPQEGDPTVVNLVPDAEGKFSQDGLRPGRYRLLRVPKRNWEAGPWSPDTPRIVEIEAVAGAMTHLELAKWGRRGKRTTPQSKFASSRAAWAWHLCSA
jgi:hypothetical protein